MKNKLFVMLFTLIFAIAQKSAFAANLGNDLGPGGVLNKDDYLMSNNGKYILKMQTDGSLVLYRLSDGTALYSMAKNGQFAVMQTDGNFVEYASNGNWLWATHTNVSTGEKRILYLRDDGSLIISCLLPVVDVYWTTGPDPSPTVSANRYPLVESNLGVKPTTIPSAGTPAESIFLNDGQVINQ